MDDTLYIKICLKLVEEKLGWKGHESWTDQDYRRLSDMISEKTEIQISHNTLKRLYGKFKYKDSYNPQTATKDALSIFLDFANWSDFIEKNRILEKPIQNKKVLVKLKFGRFFGYIGVAKKIPVKWLWVIGFSVMVITFLLFSRRPTFKYEFSTSQTEGVFPFTVSFNYDISKMGSDSVFLNLDYYHPVWGYQKLKLDPNRKNLNHCFQTPNYYKPYLIYRKNTIPTTPILIKSNGWVGYIHPDIPRIKGAQLFVYGIDNMFRDTIPDGRLYAPPSLVQSLGFDSKKTYYTDFFNFDDFGVDGDNFCYETRIKNSILDGGISNCFDSYISLVFENSTNDIRFVEKGCSRWSQLHFSEISKSGEFDDLNALTTDLGYWRIIRIKTKDKQVTVFLDGNLVFECSYKKPLGKLKGLRLYFKGSGESDYIKLYDQDNKLVYFDDFN